MKTLDALVLASFALSSLTSVASASCTGMVTQLSFVDGKKVYRVYAQFDSPDDVVLLMMDIQGVPSSGFFHSDLAGGSWAPQATIDSATDSFVLIGGVPDFSNWTAADPLWGPAGFTQPGIPDFAAWYNPNPPTLQGKVDPITLQTWVAQFSVPIGSDLSFSTPITVAYNQGLGTPTQFFNTGFTIETATIPAPAGICVLVLAGYRSRRRAR